MNPEKEFSEIKKLFELYQQDTSKSDLSHLYATCYFTKDLALVQQFKLRVF